MTLKSSSSKSFDHVILGIPYFKKPPEDCYMLLYGYATAIWVRTLVILGQNETPLGQITWTHSHPNNRHKSRAETSGALRKIFKVVPLHL